MIVYKPISSEGYEFCHPQDAEDFETFDLRIDGERRSDDWKPIPVRLVAEDEGRPLLESDSPWLGAHALVFRRRAIDVLGDLLETHGELLPLDCAEAELHVFNATKVIDALDAERSSVVRFGEGRIMRVERYVFRPEALRGIHVFKIPDLRVSPTFVDEHFVERWTSAGLVGLVFDEVFAEGR